MIQPPPDVAFSTMHAAFTSDQLREIAAAQKWLLLSLLATFFIFALPLLALPVWIFQVMMVYQMAWALKIDKAVVWTLGALIPIMGILILLHMERRATRILMAAGVRVGLLGAKATDILNLN